MTLIHAFKFSILVCVACLLLPLSAPAAVAEPGQQSERDLRMSTTGKRAAAAVARIARESATGISRASTDVRTQRDDDGCVSEPDCGGEDEPGKEAAAAPGGQAEVTIAVDETGQHVVIGYNDTRGFSENPVSLSGVLYSQDGGRTFIDGGRLPSPGNESIGNTLLPQVFGDPEVKYLGNCVFVYSSILVKKFSDMTAVQTLGLHRSRDCGKTWEGPFEITAATNPSGIVFGNEPGDAADKEFLGVDPDTGRLMVSWTNFSPPAIEIRTAYSDNAASGNPPTWSAGTVVAATLEDGQFSVPRFAAGSANAYVAWTRFVFPGTFLGLGEAITFARSLDNGVTWQAPQRVSDEFFTMDQVPGNDRVHSAPSLAVDNSRSSRRGTIYVVYASNNSGDGADILFQKSTDEGVSFSAPVEISAAPGEDRAQWFPWVSVDDTTGRVHVFYYDQGIASSGDLTEVSYVFSDDGGARWSAPVPLTKRPFHAGWGNDTGQPNLGDYNQAVAQKGELFAAFALASRPPGGFVDGQPGTQLTIPNVEFHRHSQWLPLNLNSLPLSLDFDRITLSDSDGNANGFADPGEIIRVSLPLENYTLNPTSASTARSVAALLLSETRGVQVIQPLGLYGDIQPGAVASSRREYRLRLSADFAPGTPIELKLEIGARFDGGVDIATLRHTLFSGTPVRTPLLTENFDTTAPGLLPDGWTSAHIGGQNVVPWTTNAAFCGSSNAAFHQNANDSETGNPTRWERLVSPTFNVPADADYVTVEFDVCTDTEDDPNFRVLAYDGLTLRIQDVTPGNTTRSVLVEAFADELETGDRHHFPKHLPRSQSPAYFQDMSVWAGDSQGRQRVRMRLPGMAGTAAQLRFEYTQDGFATCLDLGRGPVCGVSVDNIVVNSVRATAAPVPKSRK